MAVYQSGKKWRADVYFQDTKVLSQGLFITREDAQKWHDTQKISFQDNQPTITKTKRVRKDPLPLDPNASLKSREPVSAPPIFKDRKKQPKDLSAKSFQDLWERFEAVQLPILRTSTQVRYRLDVKYRISPFFEAYALDRVDQMVFEDFNIWLLQNLSPKSANNCLALAKTIFKKGLQWGMLKENPSIHVSLNKIPERKHSWWQNKEDIRKFLACAKHDPYYLAYRLGLDCGLRLGEIVGLSKGDINLEQGQIHIHRQWLEKERAYGPTKHGKERYIGVAKDSEIYQLLEKALKVRPASEILFFTQLGNRIGCRKLSGYYFQNLIKKSGVPKIRFHDLRHTFASWYMITTDNIWDLKYLLGHSDIQTTQRYAHLSSKKRCSPDFGWGL